MNRRWFKSLALAVSILFVSGCTPTETPTQTPTPTPTPNIAPNALITYVGDLSIVESEDVNLSAQESNDTDGMIIAYEWLDGNVSIDTDVNVSLSTLIVGEHNISLVVTDDDGATDEANITVTVVDAPVISSKLKKTGQTTTYTNYDDGYYQKGVTPNYTRDDTAEIVTDHITGLMWQDNAEALTTIKPWVTQANWNVQNYNDTTGDTANTYCENLTLGGYSDWRLPTYEEFSNIIEFNRYTQPAINPIFENVVGISTVINGNLYSQYWSSTNKTNTPYIISAWHVEFYDGELNYDNKDKLHLVRCVRAGE